MYDRYQFSMSSVMHDDFPTKNQEFLRVFYVHFSTLNRLWESPPAELYYESMRASLREHLLVPPYLLDASQHQSLTSTAPTETAAGGHCCTKKCRTRTRSSSRMYVRTAVVVVLLLICDTSYNHITGG